MGRKRRRHKEGHRCTAAPEPLRGGVGGSLQQVHAEAEAAVDANWAAITAVAEALAGTLTREQATHIAEAAESAN